MFCWKCGNEINEGDKFCTKCGAQQFKVCTKCQKRISIFDGFCIYCGEKLIAPKAVQKPKQKQKDKKNFKTYSFKFSNIKLNASKRDEINKWLSENNVIIHYLKPRFYLNTSCPGKWQASIDTLDIVYEPVETNQNYYFEYASVSGWIKRPTEKLEKIYNDWKETHPEYQILWEKEADFQTTRSEYAMSIFVLCKKIEQK